MLHKSTACQECFWEDTLFLNVFFFGGFKDNNLPSSSVRFEGKAGLYGGPEGQNTMIFQEMPQHYLT